MELNETKPIVKRQRTTFIETDVQLLLACVQNHQNTLENKKTNGITPAMKRKVKIIVYLRKISEIHSSITFYRHGRVFITSIMLHKLVVLKLWWNCKTNTKIPKLSPNLNFP